MYLINGKEKFSNGWRITKDSTNMTNDLQDAAHTNLGTAAHWLPIINQLKYNNSLTTQALASYLTPNPNY